MLNRSKLTLYISLLDAIQDGTEDEINMLVEFTKKNPHHPNSIELISCTINDTIKNAIHNNLILAEAFRDNPEAIRILPYSDDFSDLGYFVDLFFEQKEKYIERFPFIYNKQLENIPVYYSRIQLKPIHEQLFGQNVAGCIAHCYTLATNNDHAISKIRESLNRIESFYQFHTLDCIQVIHINDIDPDQHDTESLVRAIEDKGVVHNFVSYLYS
jgi:hypothetical protein